MVALHTGLLVAAPGVIRHLPSTALAAVVITAALGLFEIRGVLRLWRMRRSEFLLSVVCFLGVALIGVIEGSYGITLDPGSVSVGRLITHLRYLFVRIHQHKQLDEQHSTIGAAIRDAYPSALECALRLAGIIELRLGSPLTEDEVSYLTLHVARVTTTL